MVPTESIDGRLQTTAQGFARKGVYINQKIRQGTLKNCFRHVYCNIVRLTLWWTDKRRVLLPHTRVPLGGRPRVLDQDVDRRYSGAINPLTASPSPRRRLQGWHSVANFLWPAPFVGRAAIMMGLFGIAVPLCVFHPAGGQAGSVNWIRGCSGRTLLMFRSWLRNLHSSWDKNKLGGHPPPPFGPVPKDYAESSFAFGKHLRIRRRRPSSFIKASRWATLSTLSLSVDLQWCPQFAGSWPPSPASCTARLRHLASAPISLLSRLLIQRR